MEALVALGLAGNVVQFVQFSGQLISETKAIKRSGSPSSLPGLKRLTGDLVNHVTEIIDHLKACSTVADLAQEDKFLLKAASDCREAGNEFLTYLESLPDVSAKSKLLHSAKASFKVRWASRTIDNFVSGLETLRNALTLATILALRASTSDHHKQILANIKALQADEPLLRDIQAEFGECLSQMNTLRKDLPRSREEAILRWLYLRQISWRFDEVQFAHPRTFQFAHPRTFQWIFQGPSTGREWSDFTTYLVNKRADGPYFINGKAGSGKSTLMKLIVNDDRTQKALAEWAGTDQLIVVSFFFWNLGTELQKSHLGLLRSLLHKALETHPELIPAVFPGLCQN